jgi:HlyD family secretion protein
VSYVSLTGIAEAGVVDYRVIMTVEPPRGTQLREGLTGSATILAEQRENILLVPNRAVSRRRRDRLVQVLVDGIPQERIIKVGVSDEQYTEVVEGLAEGESVIVPSSST